MIFIWVYDIWWVGKAHPHIEYRIYKQNERLLLISIACLTIIQWIFFYKYKRTTDSELFIRLAHNHIILTWEQKIKETENPKFMAVIFHSVCANKNREVM